MLILEGIDVCVENAEYVVLELGFTLTLRADVLVDVLLGSAEKVGNIILSINSLP